MLRYRFPLGLRKMKIRNFATILVAASLAAAGFAQTPPAGAKMAKKPAMTKKSSMAMKPAAATMPTPAKRSATPKRMTKPTMAKKSSMMKKPTKS